MRTSTLSIITTAVFVILLFSLYAVALNFEIWLPRTGVESIDLLIGVIQEKFFEIAAVVLFAPLYIFVVNPINKKVLAWRKARGRDIEEEEKYETKSGILTLSLQDKEEDDQLGLKNHPINRGIEWYRRRSRD